MLASALHTVRRKSSQASSSYVNMWLGGGKDAPSPPPSSPPPHAPPSLNTASLANLPRVAISGSTFLLPTVKLPRGVGPEVLHAALQAAAAASPAARNLLTGKGNSVPLVIDLAEFIPDGSPHFVPVQDQELTNLLLALKQNSLRPIAVTSSRGMMENSIEHIAGMVGLPNVMSARGASMQATTVEELFKVVASNPNMVVPNNATQTSPPFVAEEVTPVAAPVEEYVEVEEEVDYASTSRIEEEEAQIEIEQQPIPTPTPQAAETKIYEGHVRSGQQVSSNENGNLIILGNVSSGGEVVSDGDIHIYGKLRGRALAGLAGAGGRIFASGFDPELICIDGVFTTVESARDEPTMALLGKDGELEFKKI
ncbi:hypothetical protein TrLO_g4724 [Triparma laevis f. longispina]|uniref:Septum formation inhibitor MinC C-terminal domain-containing protein n=1 Tax=Triparma laevis f. longispina TaxID=1714387 RepID=A0A9W7FB79_9STRA|nr:hypothetical protein TrLO_g4724 [Triparma laevis f. longispina]